MAEQSLSIRRWYHSDAVLGRLVCGDFQCFTLELPFKENQAGVSCVFPGLYSAFQRVSPSNGNCIQLEDRLGRTYVQIHAGNFVSDIEGCILVGDAIRLKDGTPWVTNSKDTLHTLLGKLDDRLDVLISDR